MDKVQGQEAPVVLRRAGSASRSIAQCRVVLVCAPRLLDADCKTVADMTLVNAVCRFVELATATVRRR